ncbi:hypothetical protein BO70DRAFT_349366 [Aspergillus heteromorphus CBS 117.55]|uniref:Uncharacterized protein n=1 Tax=Aspergillus heteromorphus CBS 117.55 TaxID=1448321 RepID=A0A317WWT8_9EURO|nr:uncharacterized protein BO70DRAFT_349366 [Aspergillus heteromorphus CBS 117.55]PWY90803.1 hypothetical protein BO70DRAFT_349366 [Aspergillus heteromorphus CBS 117.55]
MPPTHPEDIELNNALHAALTCTTCSITHIPKFIFHLDLKRGIYNASRNPPFRIARPEPDVAPDEILQSITITLTATISVFVYSSIHRDIDIHIDTHAPLNIIYTCNFTTNIAITTNTNTTLSPSKKPNIPILSPPYKTHHQRQRQRQYHHTPQNPPLPPHPSQSTAYTSQITTYLSLDPSHDEPFAQYLVDYHIHVHYMLQRGVLGLCRDVKDVYEVKGWRGRVHEIDLRDRERNEKHNGNGNGDGDGGGNLAPGGGTLCPEGQEQGQGPRSESEQVQVQAQAQYKSVGARTRSGWTDDPNLQMVYQMALWRKQGTARQRRIDEVRVRWAGIMEERRRQRERELQLQMQKQMQMHRRKGNVKVRVYCKQAAGGRSLLREVELDEVSFGELIR